MLEALSICEDRETKRCFRQTKTDALAYSGSQFIFKTFGKNIRKQLEFQCHNFLECFLLTLSYARLTLTAAKRNRITVSEANQQPVPHLQQLSSVSFSKLCSIIIVIGSFFHNWCPSVPSSATDVLLQHSILQSGLHFQKGEKRNSAVSNSKTHGNAGTGTIVLRITKFTQSQCIHRCTVTRMFKPKRAMAFWPKNTFYLVIST